MKLEVLLNRIFTNLDQQHENSELEFKSSTDKLSADFWETYSSFSNTSGGYIILGVQEKPRIKVVGINNPEKMLVDICNLANNPLKVSRNVIENKNISLHDIDGKTVISILYTGTSRSEEATLS